jgi:hypothetical protein
MPKFRKRPVVIEAEEYREGLEDGFVPFNDLIFTEYIHLSAICAQAGLPGVPYIKTLEGNHYISPGDYIITGVEGERYPCKPGIFKQTYEPVEESEEARHRDTDGQTSEDGEVATNA